jgi:polar amino acid transport system permease protein
VTLVAAAMVEPPRRARLRWGQLTTGGVAVALIAALAWTIAQNQSVQWSVIPGFLVDARIVRGVVLTLQLTIGAMLFGVVLGCGLAAMATSGNPVLRTIAAGYVWWFRGVFIPRIGAIDINLLITPTLAGFLALGLYEAANMSEIIRAGLNSVGPGQREAGQALGLKPLQRMWTVILPQAVRLVIPPTGNQAIAMLKASAIVSVIGMRDLLTQSQQIYAANFLVIEMLFVASIWYLGLATVASAGQYFLEKRFGPRDRGA